MPEEPQPKSPAEEMIKLWQAWMSAGMDAMQRTATLFPPGGGPPDRMAGLRDQIEKAVQAAVEAARIPSAQDFQRLVEELNTIRSSVEAMRIGLATLESLVKAQQAIWQALESFMPQATRTQQEMQQAMAGWTKQWEDRMAAMTRGLEEWRQRWEEMLRQGITVSQASQKSLEDLMKTMWDLSRKMVGGQG